MDSFDVVVIGAGSTGENVAGRVAGHGLRAAIVEERLVGGDCSYYACIPSKALLRPIRAAAAAREVDGSRQAVRAPLDVDAVLARRDEFAEHWRDDDQLPWLRDRGIELVRGRASLSGMRVVTVADGDDVRTLTADVAVAICTGSDPAVPDLPGLRAANPWTSREAIAARSVPEHLVVIGGGPVACELATIWRALGAQVTMLVRESRLLEKMEPVAGDLLVAALRDLGVQVETEASITEVERHVDATVAITLGDGRRLEGTEVLCATGRVPRTGELGLENLGLEPGGWVEVDDRMQVCAVPDGWLYAAGDVTNRALLTHMGKYEARICGDAIAARARGASSPRAIADEIAIPQVVFTDPEVAAVGCTEAAAREQGRRIDVYDFDIGEIAGARLYADDYRGAARLVVDADKNVIIGATFVGKGVAELLHAATVAIVGEVPLDRLAHAVPSFPTIGEVWLRLLENAGY